MGERRAKGAVSFRLEGRGVGRAPVDRRPLLKSASVPEKTDACSVKNRRVHFHLKKQ
jgi:hypothetical protein